MLQTTGPIAITTDVSGAATVFLGTTLRGYLIALIYRPGTIVTGAGMTVTGETSGIPILQRSNLGTGNSCFYPRALPNTANTPTGLVGTVPNVRIPLLKERIKVVVAAGGNTLSGTIEAIYETNDD